MRRRAAVRLVNYWCHKWFSADGQWIDSSAAPDTRTTCWICFGLLAGKSTDQELANAILANLVFTPHSGSLQAEAGNPPFDIFVTNLAVQLLVLFGPKFKSHVREKLEMLAIPCLRDYAGDRQGDYQFQGYNDNMPAKATMGMILGGEYFGDPEAISHGLWNLRQLGDLLARRGLISEYTSPTYTPITLVSLSEIARHSRNEEARSLASGCAERVWADILGHFHAPTGMLGGPYSRAYQPDSTAHLSTLSFLLWLWHGEGVYPDPLKELETTEVRLIHHHGSRADAFGLLGWCASSSFTPPSHLSRWAKMRQYPFSLRATAERGQFQRFDAGEILTTQHQEVDFALGTSEGDSWSQHQAEAFFLNYRLRTPAASVADVRTAYFRYFINDEMPTDDHRLPTYGNLHTVQHGRTALVLVRPILSLEEKLIDRLKFSLILPFHLGSIDKLEIVGDHVFLKDGSIYLALRSLNACNWGSKDPIRLERTGFYQCVSFYNYEGPLRTFSRQELGRTLNGVAVSVSPASERSFAEFQREVLQAKCVDYCQNGMRTVRYLVGPTLLEMSYAVEADRVRFTAINGQIVTRPTWEADGLLARRLPFLKEVPLPNALNIPFHHLRTAWGPDLPWIIAADGRSRSKTVHGTDWNHPSSNTPV